jgi:hypothetical protein
MKYQLLLLLLISLSGCSSSLVKDEKTSQKIELTKELEDEVAINFENKLQKAFTNNLDALKGRSEISREEIEDSMQEIQIHVGSSIGSCCAFRVPKDYFYKNQDEVLKVLRQRCEKL